MTDPPTGEPHFSPNDPEDPYNIKKTVKAALHELLAEAQLFQSAASAGVQPAEPWLLEELRAKARASTAELSRETLGVKDKEQTASEADKSLPYQPFGMLFTVAPDTIDGLGWLEIETAVDGASPEAKRLVVLDFSAVQRVSSSGIGRLVLLNDAVEEASGRLILLGVRSPVATIFEMMGVDTVLRAVPDFPTLLDGAQGGSSAQPTPSIQIMAPQPAEVAPGKPVAAASPGPRPPTVTPPPTPRGRPTRIRPRPLRERILGLPVLVVALVIAALVWNWVVRQVSPPPAPTEAQFQEAVEVFEPLPEPGEEPPAFTPPTPSSSDSGE